MPEFQGFNFGQVTLDAWQKARQLKENQRQFDLEQARQERQDSLMSMFKQRDYELDAMNAETSRMNAETGQANSMINLTDNYDVLDAKNYSPYKNAIKSLPSDAIPGESLMGSLKGKYLVRKPVKQSKPEDTLLRYGNIPNAPYAGEVYGYIDNNGKEVVTRFEQNKPSELSGLTEVLKGQQAQLNQMKMDSEKEKAKADLEKKQAIYNDIMNSEFSSGAYYVKAYKREFKNSEDLRRFAIDQAEKSGLPGKINKWGRKVQSDGSIITLDEGDYINNLIKEKSSASSTKSSNTKISLEEAKKLYPDEFSTAAQYGIPENDAYQTILKKLGKK